MTGPTRRTLLASLAAGACASAPASPRPNILFILPDQVRPRDLSINGGDNVVTPHIDSLAKEGVSFTNALSTCPLCTPYRGMMLSGRYPTHTGMVINWLESNPADPSIARALRSAGYGTGYIGKWHLNAGKMKRDGLFMSQEARELEAAANYAVRPKVEQDYVKSNPEPEFVPPGPSRRGFDFWAAYNFHTEFRHSYYYRDTSERLYYPGYETMGQAEVAIEYMRGRQAARQPFFAVVSPHPPHQPWTEAASPPGYPDRVRRQVSRSPNVPPSGARERGDLRYYYAMLASVDDAVGRMLGFLHSSGLEENTIVVFTSDHGEMMGSHGKWEKMSPYEDAVRVPLFVRWPGRIRPGARSGTLFTPMDHLPTLLSLAGVRSPYTQIDGMDLSGAALGRPAPERDAVLMMNYSSHWDYFHSEWPWPEWRAVRTGRHTYVKWYSGEEQLFDNPADPYQMRDLSKTAGSLLKQLRSRLAALLKEAHDDFRPGHGYAEWFDAERNVRGTGWGAVHG
ncbi:MAG: sulfatase [Bryobacterales bacterium]|nr:sulfatase [Bryobacterales bacterium]